MRHGWLAIILLLSTSAFATRHNGYIVKFKEGRTQKVMALKGKLNSIKTLFGTFAQIGKDDLESYKNNSDIELIEPNYIYTVKNFGGSNGLLNDAKFEDQWGLQNDGKNSSTPK